MVVDKFLVTVWRVKQSARGAPRGLYKKVDEKARLQIKLKDAFMFQIDKGVK
jgi:hypothetical protein